MAHRIVVVELADVVPRRAPDKPNLYVGLADASANTLEQIVADSDCWIRDNALRLREDLAPSTRFKSRSRARERRAKVMGRLQGIGFTVNRDTTVFRLYVIELDPEGVRDVGKGYVYVGGDDEDRRGALPGAHQRGSRSQGAKDRRQRSRPQGENASPRSRSPGRPFFPRGVAGSRGTPRRAIA